MLFNPLSYNPMFQEPKRKLLKKSLWEKGQDASKQYFLHYDSMPSPKVHIIEPGDGLFNAGPDITFCRVHMAGSMLGLISHCVVYTWLVPCWA